MYKILRNTVSSKSNAIHYWHMFCLSTNKFYWNQKIKKILCTCWKRPPCSVMHAFTLFLMCVASRWRVHVSRKRFTRRDIVGLFCIGEERNVTMNWFWQVKYERDARWCSTVNTRCTCEKDILALDCLKTTDGLTRAGCSMTWPVWAFV
jgi:hypothetical protein